jgi:hypothetical protein
MRRQAGAEVGGLSGEIRGFGASDAFIGNNAGLRQIECKGRRPVPPRAVP